MRVMRGKTLDRKTLVVREVGPRRKDCSSGPGSPLPIAKQAPGMPVWTCGGNWLVWQRMEMRDRGPLGNRDAAGQKMTPRVTPCLGRPLTSVWCHGWWRATSTGTWACPWPGTVENPW